MKHKLLKTIGDYEIGKLYYNGGTGKYFYLVERKRLGPKTIQIGFVVTNSSENQKYKYRFFESKIDTKIENIYEILD